MTEIESFKSAHEAVYAMTIKLKNLIEYRESERFRLAISGGQTANTMFDIWRESFAKKIDWNCVDFFWADERMASDDPSKTNFKNANERFFAPLKIAPENIFRAYPACNPLSEAVRLGGILKSSNSQKIELDCAILGIGLDGHCASIFPDNPQIFYSQNVYDTVLKIDENFERITLTPNALLQASELMFLVLGKDKREILHTVYWESLSGAPQSPCAKILASADSSAIYTDIYL